MTVDENVSPFGGLAPGIHGAKVAGTIRSTCKTLTSESYFHAGVPNRRLIKAVDFDSHLYPLRTEQNALI